MELFRRAKIRLSLALRRLGRRPVKLCYPLDGLRGHFPAAFALLPPEVHYVNQMVEHIRGDFVCFDVGAHVGYYTLLFSRFARQVVAFEPIPANIAVLRRNIRLNGLGNVRVCQTAVGREEGTLRLTANLGSDSMASAFRTDGLEAVDSPVIDLDTFCERNGLEPDLVKIDVEGSEVDVLAGMQGILDRKRPILFLDIHAAYVPEDGIDGMLAELRQRGYRVFSWQEDVMPGGHGFWRGMREVGSAADLAVGAVLALPSAPD